MNKTSLIDATTRLYRYLVKNGFDFNEYLWGKGWASIAPLIPSKMRADLEKVVISWNPEFPLILSFYDGVSSEKIELDEASLQKVLDALVSIMDDYLEKEYEDFIDKTKKEYKESRLYFRMYLSPTLGCV